MRALAGIACAGLAAVVLAAVDDTVMVKMRDGVRLSATVYRPADADRMPVIR